MYITILIINISNKDKKKKHNKYINSTEIKKISKRNC